MKLRTIAAGAGAIAVGSLVSLNLASPASAQSSDGLRAVAYDVVAGYDGAGQAIAADPGSLGDLLWGVANQGDQWVHGLVFTVILPDDVFFDAEYGICEYDSTVAVCTDPDAVVAPGGVYAPESPTVVQIPFILDGPTVLGGGLVAAAPIELSDTQPAAGDPAPGFRDDLDEASFQLLLQQSAAAPAEVDLGTDTDTFQVHIGAVVPNDLAVTSEPAEGEVGEVIEVDFAITNHGPGTSGPVFAVEAPSGTVVPGDAGVFDAVSGDYPTCTSDGSPEWAEATELSCSFEGEVQAGVTVEFKLPFEIQSAQVGDDGLITVRDLGELDSNPENDTAPIVIDVSTGGSGGGTLPITGFQAGLLGGVGAGALVVGVALFVLARRRRIVVAAPDIDG